MTSKNSPTLRENRTHGTQSFRCAFYTVPSGSTSFHVPLHWHDEVEILHFRQGSFILEVNLERYIITEECLFFLNSGELHRIICDEPCLESAVVFSPYILNFVTNDSAQSEILLPLARQRLLLPRCLLPEQPDFAPVLHEYQTLSRIFTETADFSASTPHQQLFIKASLLNILGNLSSGQQFAAAKEPLNENIEDLKTVLTYIYDHYPEKICIRDLALLLNLNEQYFCRFFKKAIGQSPIAYINAYRIRKAAELLSSSSLSVTEVALECGFCNAGNFFREFRRQTGTTPLQYRYKNDHKKSK